MIRTRPILTRLLLAFAAAPAGLGTVHAQDLAPGARAAEQVDVQGLKQAAEERAAAMEAFAAEIRARADAAAVRAAAEAAAAGKANRYAGSGAPTGTGVAGLDLDALLRQAEELALAAAADTTTPRLLVFASFSMPADSLAPLVRDVARVGGVVVFRGFLEDSASETAAAATALFGEGEPVAMGIDPRLFQAFQIDAVPLFVVAAAEVVPDCSGFTCATDLPAHDRLAGNVTLAYALETMAAGDGAAAAVARVYRDRLVGEDR